MKIYGLIGKPLGHSFSQKYFTEKFKKLNITDCKYKLFPLKDLGDLPELLNNNPDLAGLNVTLPYKVSVIPYLDEVDTAASVIGSVNTIKIYKNTHAGSRSAMRSDNFKLVGYNTDAYGFEKALIPFLKSYHKDAFIIGTGGAAKAVGYVFKKLGIERTFISRNPKNDFYFNIKDFSEEDFKNVSIIVNASPLGMNPHPKTCPPIPYHVCTPKHLLFDLVYNPSETLFMKKGKDAGAVVTGGLKMLYYQADKSWDIWNNIEGHNLKESKEILSTDL
jgi:shikimate dehydrogenase